LSRFLNTYFGNLAIPLALRSHMFNRRVKYLLVKPFRKILLEVIFITYLYVYFVGDKARVAGIMHAFCSFFVSLRQYRVIYYAYITTGCRERG